MLTQCILYNMKYKTILFWLLVFGILTAFLQYFSKFHYFFIEQKNLFLFTGSFALDRLTKLGGVATYLSEFLMQFFIYPFAGALITAGLLTGIGILMQIILKRISKETSAYILYLLPSLFLLFIQFDFNYLNQGTIAYMVMLCAFIGYIYIHSYIWQLVLGAILIPLMYYTMGSVSLLFSVMLVVWELFNKQPKRYWVFFLLLEAVFIAVLSVYFSFAGEYKFAFLPDMYYHPKLEPKVEIYFAWWILPLNVLIVCFTCNRKLFQYKMMKTWFVIQLLLLICITYWGFEKYGDRNSYKMKTLDYYARTEQWDKILADCEGVSLNNFLYLNYLNLALAQKEILADKMFYFSQNGATSLIVDWNKTAHVSVLLSDIYFSLGNIASAQEMAFEANLSDQSEGNPRMLKRLIQTNLIYGAYSVAEKYISILEKTLYYRAWASQQRIFLNNDAAVVADSLLGNKRKCLSEINHLMLINGFGAELEAIAVNNPADKTAIHFLGCLYLLSKDLEAFKNFIEKYYGTEILPVLPVSFQEAIITYAEKDADYWKQYGVSDQTAGRFLVYRKNLIANKTNPNLKNDMFQAFGNTYWYYLMFKN